jgi:hypothetical protein
MILCMPLEGLMGQALAIIFTKPKMKKLKSDKDIPD